MFLFFSLSVPAGLVLYWVASNLYQMVQQYFLTGWGQLRPSAVLPAAARPRRRPRARRRARRSGDAQTEPVEQGAPRVKPTPSNTGRRRRNKRR